MAKTNESFLPPIRKLQIKPLVEYQEAPSVGGETFDELEERIESNIYEARKALRDG